MSYVYETDAGERFAMCDVCVLTTADICGEYYCPGCHRWYFIQHTDGEFLVERLYDRDVEGRRGD